MRKLLWATVLLFIFVGCESGINFVAHITVTPASYDFDNVAAGNTASQDFVVSNTGVATLKINNIEITNLGANTTAGEFTITQVLDNSGNTIAAPYTNIKIKVLQQITITVQFAPADTQNKEATLSLTHSDSQATNPFEIPLSGNAAQFAIDNNSHDYGQVAVGSNSDFDFTITNNGTADLTISQILFNGDAENDYSVISPATIPFTVSANGGTRTLTVRFSPSITGVRDATMQITHDGANEASPYAVSLTGTGLLAMNHTPVILDSAPNVLSRTVSSLITVRVYDPDGLSDISSVTIDLTNIGGSATQQMFDDGTNGNVTPNDGVYSCHERLDRCDRRSGRLAIHNGNSRRRLYLSAI